MANASTGFLCRTASKASLMFNGGHKEDELFYDKASSIQKLLLQESGKIMMSFLNIASWDKENPPKHYSICDFGCADGLNATRLIYKVITSIRQHYESLDSPLQFTVIYEDQAENDFRPIHKDSETEEASNSPQLLRDLQNVFILSTGVSFYNQCLPKKMVDLATSFTAVHWLSEVPCSITDAVLPNFSKDHNVLKQFRAKAAEDWETFLLHRAQELKVGGHLFVTVVSSDGEGACSLSEVNDEGNMFNVLHSILKELDATGYLTSEETARIVYCAYARSGKEIEAPFLSPNSPVRLAGLQLVGLKLVTVMDPLFNEWRNGSDPWSDAALEEHSQSCMELVRTFMGHVVLEALNESRNKAEKDAILNTIFFLFKSAVKKDPEHVTISLSEYAISIRKMG